MDIVRRPLVVRQLPRGEIAQRGGVQGRVVAADDQGHDLLLELVWRQTDDVRRFDLRMRAEHRLNFGGRDIDAFDPQQVLAATDEMKDPAFIDTSEIAGTEKPLRVESA